MGLVRKNRLFGGLMGYFVRATRLTGLSTGSEIIDYLVSNNPEQSTETERRI